MRTQVLPGCCGVTVFYDLYNISDEELEKVLQGTHKKERRGLILAVTESYGRKYQETILKRYKFKKLISKFKNPRHNTVLTLWCLKTPENKTRPKRSFKDLWRQPDW